MKSRAKFLTNNNGAKPLNIESKAKIYVPISIANQGAETTQQNLHASSDQALFELRKANLEFKEKQEIYIDKLIKLEEGLEKQHLEFKQLQDLYNQLLNSYKHKQEEISELEQKYRESNRKKESGNHFNIAPQPRQNELELKKLADDQKNIVDKLEAELTQSRSKVAELSKTVERLLSENAYYKNKDKMNDSRASLNSKVFEELGEWQRQADIQKEEKIKLDYQNKFLRSRNQDLQQQVGELEQILLQKQTEVLRLRQNNIILCRENSESRLIRSSSRSPGKSEQKQGNDGLSEKRKKNRIVEQLYEENKVLKRQLELEKAKGGQSSRSKNEYFIKQEQFYSFSQDDHSNHSSSQEGQHSRNLNKQLFIKVEKNYEVQDKDKLTLPHFVEDLNNSHESLQELPAELQIDNLILKNQKKAEIQP